MASEIPKKVPFSSKKDKVEVNYRIAEKCQTCDHYSPNTCRIVEGNIAPQAVCDLWAIRSSLPGGIYGEFYLNEYQKSRGGA
jgi:hypothetical protein